MTMIKVMLLIENNKAYALSILVMSLASIFVSIYKTQQINKYEQIATEVNQIIGIISNGERVKFIQKHRFCEKKTDIKDFMRKVAQTTYAKISSMEKISEEKIGKINVATFKIIGLFWHDCFIFEFLEKIQTFSPGFLNIETVDIDKLSKKIVHKPMLKLEVICRIFQKL